MTDMTQHANPRERGAALVVAISILALLTTVGLVLVFFVQGETEVNQVDVTAKQAFYMAESALEKGRKDLKTAMGGSNDFDARLVAAAGTGTGTQAIDCRPENLTGTFNAAGELTAIDGCGNDAPVVPLTSVEGGKVATYLVNDELDGIASQNDTNDRVVLLAVGSAGRRSLSVVQGIVAPPALMPLPPSAITLLGPGATFDGGNSNAQDYSGTDCGHCTDTPACSGASGSVPIVGLTDTATANIDPPKSGTISGTLSANVSSQLSASMKTCTDFVALVRQIRDAADRQGTADAVFGDADGGNGKGKAAAAAPGDKGNGNGNGGGNGNGNGNGGGGTGTGGDTTTTGNSDTYDSSAEGQILFVKGNVDNLPAGSGILVIEGDLLVKGNNSWKGLIIVLGGSANFGGTSGFLGGVIVANVTGDDLKFGTADDCADGFESASFTVNGGGTSLREYCSSVMNNAWAARPLRLVNFRQQ